MRRSPVWPLLAGAFMLALPGTAKAQAGVTPLLTGPNTLPTRALDIGGYVTIEDEFDVFGAMRLAVQRDFDLGVRAGYTDAADGGVHLGGDLRYRVHGGTDNFPLALAFVGGLQLSFADDANLIAVPFGVSLGRLVGTNETPVMLYGAPHLRIMSIDPDNADGDTELELSVELGAQVQVTPRLFFDGALTLASDDDDNVGLGLGLRWR